MRIFLTVMLILGAIALAIIPMAVTFAGNSGMSEAPYIYILAVPVVLAVLVMSLLFLFGVGKQTTTTRGSAAISFWATSLLFCLLVGGVVAYVSYSSYEENRQDSIRLIGEAISAPDDSSRSMYIDESFRARNKAMNNLYGIIYSGALLLFSVLSVIGLGVGVIMLITVKPNTIHHPVLQT